ncbi:MAG: acyl carrier protein [Bacilli bacterium]|nr:acyl carrier protein [Bacilli bacterium]
MNRQEIAKTIVELIRANMPGFENMEVDEAARINTEQGFDSMTFVYIMCKIEAQFGISIPKRRWEKMVTLGDVVDAVEKELAKK